MAHDKVDDAVRLSSAVARAVRETGSLLDGLSGRVAAVFEAAAAAGGFLDEVSALEKQVLEALAVHREQSGTFRVVLFGRTGAGKSSLIEALTAGDGQSISTGESDFTTAARRVPWGSLELIDTPGISGWGRTATRKELEELAGDAVASADLVLLCFDDQNQQASEFAVVRREIQRYGRPAVAILNVRNPRWREPGTQARGSVLQRQVAGHATHLRQELSAVGMPHVPVVAVNTLRAVAARAGESYAGPDADLVRSRLAKYGAANLEMLSNVTRLEMLLAACLRDGAPQLRFQAVESDILGRVQMGTVRLHERAAQGELVLEDATAELAAVLDVVGSGSDATARRGRWSRESVPGGDALTQLQALRPELLPLARSAGSFQKTAETLFETHVSPHRRQLQEVAEGVARRALTTGSVLSGDELMKELAPAIEAAELAGRQGCELLEAEFEQQIEGLALRVAFTQHKRNAKDINGKTSRTIANVLEVADVGVSLGVAIATVVVLSTGPIGWAVLAGGTLLSLAVGWGRRRAARAAEARGARVRSEAIAAVRRVAEAAYADIMNDLWDEVSSVANQVATRVLGPRVEAVLELATQTSALDRAAGALDALEHSRGATQAEDVLVAARQSVRRRLRLSSSVDPLLGQDSVVELDADGVSPVTDSGRLLEEDFDRRAAAWLLDRKGSTGADSESRTVGLLGAPRVGISALNNAMADHLSHMNLNVVELCSLPDQAEECDLLVWLLAPNVSLAGLPAFQDLFMADVRCSEAVLARSLFCVTRSDQLGPDLVQESDALVSVMRRKSQEVSDLLATQGVVVSANTVVFVAPNPFGAEPEPSAERLTGVLPVSLMLSEAASFGASQRARHAQLVDAERGIKAANGKRVLLENRLSWLDEVLSLTGSTVAARERHLQHSERRLRSQLGDRVDALAMDVCVAPTRDALEAALDRLRAWLTDAEVEGLLEAWLREFLAEQEALSLDYFAELQVVMNRGQLGRIALGPGASKFGGALNSAASLLKAAGQSRDSWYALVKFVSRGAFKFKPWGAIKGAGAAKLAGKWFAIAGVVITSFEIWLDRHGMTKRREVQERILGDARTMLDDVLTEYLHGPSGEPESGLFWLVQAELDELRTDAEKLRGERNEVQVDLEVAVDDEAAATTTWEEL